MILEYENYVGSDLVEEIRQRVSVFTRNSRPTTYNRDGATVCISETLELQDLDSKISSVFTKFQADVIQQRFKPNFSSGDSGYEYHLYRPGDICRCHADGELHRPSNSSSLLRYATVIIFLTDNEDGELVFPTQNIEIKPRKGKIVAFPPYGFFEHYSKPAKENREILMSWFVYNGITVHKNAN